MRYISLAVCSLFLMTFVACQAPSANPGADQDAARASAAAEEARIAARKALSARVDELQKRVDALKVRPEVSAKAKEMQDELARERALLSTERGRELEWNKAKLKSEEALRRIEDKLNELGPPR